MTEELLLRLAQAFTEDERSWIVTESLIETLSLDAQRLIWSAAIPHWFNLEILTVLHPELEEKIDELYLELQKLSFVDIFPGRGHSIHERTRKAILKHFYGQREQEYLRISAKLVSYFDREDTEPSLQIEQLYHLVVVNSERASTELCRLSKSWINSFRQVECESLFKALSEQIDANRAPKILDTEISHLKKQAGLHSHKTSENLEINQADGFCQEASSQDDTDRLKPISGTQKSHFQKNKIYENGKRVIVTVCQNLSSEFHRLKVSRKIDTFEESLDTSNEKNFKWYELLSVIVIIGILSAVASPSFMNQIAKARSSKARSDISTINRAQKLFFLKNNKFSSKILELDVNIKTSASDYTYTVQAHNSDKSSYAISTATSKKAYLKGYVGGVFAEGREIEVAGEKFEVFVIILCENKRSSIPFAMSIHSPKLIGGQAQCGSGSTKSY
jgi:Tfp pilus assembly protein PilE